MLSPDELARLDEIERRLANVVRLGTVASVDADRARVRVRYDRGADGAPVLTGWLPWLTHRAGAARTWWAPSPGEQVALLAPGGELPQAAVLPAIYRTTHPAPDSDPAKRVTLHPDGARIEYDATLHRLTAVLPAGATTALTSPGGIAVTGDVTVTGNVTASGDVTDARSSMQDMRDAYNPHTHPPGPATPSQMT